MVRPLLLALTLSAGVGAVWLVLSIWAWAVAEHVAGQSPTSSDFVVLSDGTPAVAESTRGGGTTYRDLDGQPIDRPAGQLGHVWTPILPPGPEGGRPEGWSVRVRSFSDGGEPAVYWYFVCDGEAGHFVGYDSRSKTLVGFLGRGGFRDVPLTPEERFPFGGEASGPTSRLFSPQRGHAHYEHPRPGAAGKAPRGSLSGWDVYVLDDEGRLHHADLQRRTVSPVPDLPPLLSASLVQGVLDPVRGTPTHVAARTADAVLVLDERGGVMRRYPVPAALRGRAFQFAEMDAAGGLMYQRGPLDSLGSELSYDVFWASSDGRSRSRQVTLPYSSGKENLPLVGGLLLPSPLVLSGLIATLRPAELRREGLEPSYTDGLRRALREYRPALLSVWAVAIVLAGLCHRRQARYAPRGPNASPGRCSCCCSACRVTSGTASAATGRRWKRAPAATPGCRRTARPAPAVRPRCRLRPSVEPRCSPERHDRDSRRFEKMGQIT
ncbi:MAG: hypothetical protein U0797_10350 [Gemmataceae bacterium]